MIADRLTPVAWFWTADWTDQPLLDAPPASEAHLYTPVYAAEDSARNQQLEALLREAQEWAKRIAGDERVCGWVHHYDYGLYCLLADCPIDFEAALSGAQASEPDEKAAAHLREELVRAEQRTRHLAKKENERG